MSVLAVAIQKRICDQKNKKGHFQTHQTFGTNKESNTAHNVIYVEQKSFFILSTTDSLNILWTIIMYLITFKWIVDCRWFQDISISQLCRDLSRSTV